MKVMWIEHLLGNYLEIIFQISIFLGNRLWGLTWTSPFKSGLLLSRESKSPSLFHDFCCFWLKMWQTWNCFLSCCFYFVKELGDVVDQVLQVRFLGYKMTSWQLHLQQQLPLPGASVHSTRDDTRRMVYQRSCSSWKTLRAEWESGEWQGRVLEKALFRSEGLDCIQVHKFQNRIPPPRRPLII